MARLTFRDIDRGWDDMIDMVRRIDRFRPARTVGVHKTAVDDKGFMAERAAENEFGVPERDVPERSFLRSTFDEKNAGWARQMGIILSSQSFSSSPSELLRPVAEAAVRQVREKVATVEPPNAPSTVARKGFNQPLVETGRMGDSIDHEAA